MRCVSVLVSGLSLAALAVACAHGPVDATTTADDTQGDAAASVPAHADASLEAAAAQDDASPPDPPDSGTQTSPDATPAYVPDAGPPPDAGACTRVGPSKACGVAPQCGCSANETCDLTPTGDSQCVGPAGLGAAGNHCVNDAACKVGLTCAYGDSCRPFCTTAGQACGASNLGTCVQLHDAKGAAIPNLLVCEIKCQLQDPSSCGFGSGCFQSSVTAGASDCYAAGTKGLNQVCVYADDCQAGFGCIGVGSGTYHCKHWCRVGQGATDCGGATCTGFSPALVMNNVTYGTCP
jgi:hypothetical protein